MARAPAVPFTACLAVVVGMLVPLPPELGVPPPAPGTDRSATALDIRYFGATGDGDSDDTAALVAAVESGYDIYVPPGEYGVTRPLEPKSGQTIEMAPDATIKFFGDDLQTGSAGGVPRWGAGRTAIIHLANVEDVTITGGHLTDESDDEELDTYGMAIRGSRNVLVRDTVATAFDHDGFYIERWDDATFPENVRLIDVKVDDVGRNGISVPSGRNIALVRPRVSRAQHGAIHFEPNRAHHPLVGIRVVSLHAENNNSAVRLNLGTRSDGAGDVDVLIHNPVAVGDFDVSYQFRKAVGALGGRIRLHNPVSDGAGVTAFRIRDWSVDGPLLEISNPMITRFGVNPDGRASSRGTGFDILAAGEDLEGPIGNVHVFNATIEAHPDAHAEAVDVALGDFRDDAEGFSNIIIEGADDLRCYPDHVCVTP